MSRWGQDDERGALNLVGTAATLRGIATVRDGAVVPLNLIITGNEIGPAVPFRGAPRHFMIRDGGDYAAGVPERGGFGFSDDVLMLATHGTTHIDALAHVWRDGRMYNGFPSSTVTSKGAQHCGIDKAGPFVTRALFADFGSDPAVAGGAPIHRAQLIAAVERGGIGPEPGDALVIRTGWMAAWRRGEATTKQSSGLHHDCAEWIIESGFALVAADNPAVEALPSGDNSCSAPLHIALTRDNGVYLAELLDLEALCVCRRVAFLLCITPLKIKGGVGSPIAPVAIL